jgi:hypothetical protein
MPESFGRNHADERQGVEGFHLLKTLPDRAFAWAPLDKEGVSSIRESMVHLKEKYPVESDERRNWETWYSDFAPKLDDVNKYVESYRGKKEHYKLIFKEPLVDYLLPDDDYFKEFIWPTPVLDKLTDLFNPNFEWPKVHINYININYKSYG